MKPHLILHIGTTKTGSTALQNFLFANRDSLLEEGFLFPNSGFRILNNSQVPTSGHSDLFYKQGMLEELTKEINENIYIDLDSHGGIVTMTIEHAKLAANISELSFQQMEPAG